MGERAAGSAMMPLLAETLILAAIAFAIGVTVARAILKRRNRRGFTGD